MNFPLSKLKSEIARQGGFVNAHAHFDRAYSVTEDDLKNTSGSVNSTLHEKWKLVDKYKAQATETVYYQNIVSALEFQHAQGVRAVLSFIDCDEVAGERALLAAVRAKQHAREKYGIQFLIACQTLKGVLEPTAREWFERSLPHIDVIGGLPGADKGRAGEHLDVLLQAAKRTQKRVHVHVDQLNCASERETELLCRKVMEHGVEGLVTAVHGISIGAHKKEYRHEVYKMCKDAGLSFVACPTAWIDSRRTEVESPTHNAVTPVDEMIPAGLTVAIGSDNVADLYKPFSDGDMFTELRVLLESTHFYDVNELVKIATYNGLKVMGLD
jgi:cytosine deaminase